MATSDLRIAVLAGAVAAARELERDDREAKVNAADDRLAAVARLAENMTDADVDAALDGAARLMDDPMAAEDIRAAGDELAEEIDRALTADETVPPEQCVARRNLLLSLMAFFFFLLVLQLRRAASGSHQIRNRGRCAGPPWRRENEVIFGSVTRAPRTSRYG